MTSPALEPVTTAVVRWLRRVGLDTDSIGAADLMWLASALPVAGKRESVAEASAPAQRPATRRGTRPDPNPRSRPGDISTAPDPHRSTGPTRDIVAAASAPSGEGVGVPVAVAGRRARSKELAGSMRALKRRWPAGRRLQLDLDRTVEVFGATAHLLPAFRPARERWFDAHVVVDGSGSGPLWDKTVERFVRLLEGLGAFRTIRRWYGSIPDGAMVLRDAAGRERSAMLLRSADRRGLVFVISDFTDPGWLAAEPWRVIAGLGQTNAVVLVSLLPPKLRHLTAAGLPPGRAHSMRPGSPNAELRWQAPLRDGRPGTAVPVVGLTASDVAEWAGTLMRCQPSGCLAVLVPEGRSPMAGTDSPLTLSRLSGQRLVELFRLLATPEARTVATLASSFSHVSISVLKFVAETMVPAAADADLAHVVASGLLIRSADSEELRFAPGVRDVLQRHLMAPDVWRIRQCLTEYVATNAGRAQRIAGQTDGMTSAIRPFVEASQSIEALLGLAARNAAPAAYRKDPDAVPTAEEAARRLNARMASFVAANPAVERLTLVANDGMKLAVHPNRNRDQNERMAAAASVVDSLARGFGVVLKSRHTMSIVMTDGPYFYTLPVGDNAVVTASIRPRSDGVADELALLAAELLGLLKPWPAIRDALASTT